jgi:hypothetical protein
MAGAGEQPSQRNRVPVLLEQLVAPMARRQAKKQVPADQLRLKQRLEAGA